MAGIFGSIDDDDDDGSGSSGGDASIFFRFPLLMIWFLTLHIFQPDRQNVCIKV